MNNDSKTPIVPPQYLLGFITLTICFAAWGLANNMTDPLVKVFMQIFTMSNLESSLVQSSFYGAYFCLAIPAAIIIKKYTYKTGVLIGLGMFIFGGLLFYPASKMMDYHAFLAAIFILASGLSILETSCNPFIVALGDEKTATQRLNLAQAFNPVGSLLGIFLATTVILPNVNEKISGVSRKVMQFTEPEKLVELQTSELMGVMTPYVGLSCVLILLWLLIKFSRLPNASDAGTKLEVGPTLGRLLRNKHYSLGVVAQFFYVAAQICCWTYTIHYVSKVDQLQLREFTPAALVTTAEQTSKLRTQAVKAAEDYEQKHLNEFRTGKETAAQKLALEGLWSAAKTADEVASAAELNAIDKGAPAATERGFTVRSILAKVGLDTKDGHPINSGTAAGYFVTASLICFSLARFICTALMRVIRPSLMLTVMAISAIGFCIGVMTSVDTVGVLCLVGISFCMSLMFPTIYGIALHGLGDDLKFGGSGLVMAILGGAVATPIQATLIDSYGEAFSYIIPLICFVVVTLYAIFDLKVARKSHFAN